MAREAEEIVDHTPLAASRIDIASRIGWLLRTWRTNSGLSLRAVAERLDRAFNTIATTLQLA
ncbi:MAG: hypothetical protein QM572_03450 [Nocardioides sp.]|uniref:hypothetical protein n=1 Tax=Nocardioides sp. TaxID=35761 RepID=UPI0039E5CE3E